MKKSSFTFRTKAKNLEQLLPTITTAKIPPLYSFPVSAWERAPGPILNAIATKFGTKKIIVRSSAAAEDSHASSHAGEFLSIADLSSAVPEELRDAVKEVIASYTTKNKNDEVLVQEQVFDVALSGVLFTRDLDTRAPYYIINYDTSGSIDGVTSGLASSTKTYVRFRHAKVKSTEPHIEAIVNLATELFTLTGSDALDIEFAVDKKGVLYLLQVRPIASGAAAPKIDEQHLEMALFRVQKKIEKLNGPHPGVHGVNAMYSVMTDWNPAEIIGTKPRTLALSLYKELIMDSIWAYQRNNYGYKNLRGFPLLISFLGMPYIDVRASFNSFIPATLDEDLTEKLADYYAKKLQQTPTDHDKVEFKIVYSCYFLNLSERLKELLANGFTELEVDRIKFSLLQLTNNIISPTTGLYRADQERIAQLDKKFNEICQGNLPLIDKLYWLIEDCKRFGTLPFAGLARAGFIAVQMLHSLVDLQIITTDELNYYLRSLNTVSKQLVTDFDEYRSGKRSRADILKEYGHLRPGTYDILSARYDEAFDVYFAENTAPKSAEHHGDDVLFQLSEDQREKIKFHLVQNGIQATVDELFNFIREAIEAREYSKFVFTRSLSHVLLLLEHLGRNVEISKEEMSFLDIKTILSMYSSLTSLDVGTILRENIKRNTAEYEVTKMIKLPDLIISPDDIYHFYLRDSEPNFVTQKRVIETVILEDDLAFQELENKIIMIRSADPGYDWLFSRKIAGLVTMYGGANSHMAIRCAELQIPAAIGCGERLFDELAVSPKIEIDCSARQIRKIN